MSNEKKNNNECKFNIEINGTVFNINVIQSNGAKLTYEELIKKIMLDEVLKIKAENVA